jgi:hypothetical protein
MKSLGMIAMLIPLLLACGIQKKGFPSSDLKPKIIDGEHYVYVLPSGEQAFVDQFDYASEFEDGYAIISDSNEICGIIDSTGTIILPYSILTYGLPVRACILSERMIASDSSIAKEIFAFRQSMVEMAVQDLAFPKAYAQ